MKAPRGLVTDEEVSVRDGCGDLLSATCISVPSLQSGLSTHPCRRSGGNVGGFAGSGAPLGTLNPALPPAVCPPQVGPHPASELTMTVHRAFGTDWTLVAAVLMAGSLLVSHWVADEADGDLPRPVSVVPVEAPSRPPIDVASWYGEWHHGRPTASGKPFDRTALTAAHRSLPLGTCLEVTNLGNDRRVWVRVNDRGPYVPGRTIDLSQRAAAELGMVDEGLARVRIHRARAEVCED
jgi:peptidoglycan lytic transglycosylase